MFTWEGFDQSGVVMLSACVFTHRGLWAGRGETGSKGSHFDQEDSAETHLIQSAVLSAGFSI